MGKGGWRYGAGRPGYRIEAEGTFRFDVREWERRKLLTPGRYFSWSWTCNGEHSGSIGVQSAADRVRLEYSASGGDASQLVALVREPCRFGGSRVWFLCPCCYRRAAVLFFRQGRFACRKCQRVRYRSQSGSASDRICQRYHRLADKVEAGKPKWQRWATFERTCERLERFSEAMDRQLAHDLLALGLPL